uniref:Uncharacterized protein n=2 Tax=Globisporangium ultimum TaxID=2052682 RepID=K3X8J1_GLOUD|nr:spore wall protein [Globisporangium ultimum]
MISSSGAVEIQSYPATNGGSSGELKLHSGEGSEASGPVFLNTGPSSSGFTGNMTLTTGKASGGGSGSTSYSGVVSIRTGASDTGPSGSLELSVARLEGTCLYQVAKVLQEVEVYKSQADTVLRLHQLVETLF